MTMRNLKTTSSQEIAKGNAQRLEVWIKSTPLHKVPLNSKGESAKSNICRVLEIAPSTIGTNSKIKLLFGELDKKLLKRSITSISPRPSRQATDSEQASTTMLQVLDELERLRASNARLRHLDVTGQFIPEK